MRVGKLKKGAILQVGFKIKRENWNCTQWFDITRVTSKFAFIKWNEKAEGKLRRVVLENGCVKEAGNNDTWSQVTMTAWRPLTDEELKVMVKK
jgi:hypothetical protein